MTSINYIWTRFNTRKCTSLNVKSVTKKKGKRCSLIRQTSIKGLFSLSNNSTITGSTTINLLKDTKKPTLNLSVRRKSTRIKPWGIELDRSFIGSNGIRWLPSWRKPFLKETIPSTCSVPGLPSSALKKHKLSASSVTSCGIWLLSKDTQKSISPYLQDPPEVSSTSKTKPTCIKFWIN